MDDMPLITFKKNYWVKYNPKVGEQVLCKRFKPAIIYVTPNPVYNYDIDLEPKERDKIFEILLLIYKPF